MADDLTVRSPSLRVFDYLFILRPAVMVPLWVFFIAGTATGLGRRGAALVLSLPRESIVGLVAMTALLGGGYVLNQIRDIESDRANRKLFFLPSGLISLRAARLELAVVWLVACALSLSLSWQFRLLAAASLFLNVTYSAGPMPGKSRFPLDLLWNGLGFGLVAFLAGAASAGPIPGSAAGLGICFALSVAGVTASTTILDVKGDGLAGLRTTAIVLGEKRTSLLAVGLMSCAVALGLWLRDSVAFFGPLLSLPMLLRAHASGSRRDRIVANQAAVAAFALVVSLRAPVLPILILVTYLASRAYYRARFDLTYPEIGPSRARNRAI